MFTIYLIYHSHIDIGYTERQERITDYQADFIRQAVEQALSSRQTSRGGNSKFRFAAEGFWAVEQYLRRYGEGGRARLVEAVKSGHFELTSCYFHLTELLNADNLAHSLNKAANFVKENKLPTIKNAMASDVNGFSWGFSDLLYKTGARNLFTSINSHHGGAPFRRPLVPFYWKTPKGERLLVYSGFSYHGANALGMIAGPNYIGNPGLSGLDIKGGWRDVRDISVMEDTLPPLVEKLRSVGYKYDFLPIMGSGICTDNSPCDDLHCSLAERWNAVHGGEITVKTATLSEFFARLEKENGLPEYSGDWNDWWTDGVISTPNETRLFRNAQRVQAQIKSVDPEGKIITKAEHAAVSDKLLVYAEHTWGHSDSFYNPARLSVLQLDARKCAPAIEADLLAESARDKLAAALGETEFTSRRELNYKIVNPSDRARREMVLLSYDFWEGMGPTGSFGRTPTVTGADGQTLPFQKTHSLRGAALACSVELPPRGKTALKIRYVADGTSAVSADFVSPHDKERRVYDNGFYRLQYSDDGVISLKTKTGKELLDTAQNALGAPVYQIFRGGNRSAAAGFGYTKRDVPKSDIVFGRAVRTEVAEDGAVFTRLRTYFETEGASRVMTSYTLYHDSSRIDVSFEMAKSLVLDPEGMYVSLPFKSGIGRWKIDKVGGILPLDARLPGTCCDYYAVQRGAVLEGGDESVVVNTLDSPMVTFGHIKLWSFSEEPEDSGALYSWLTNNKWETNFRTHSAGVIESRYVINIIPSDSSSEETLEAGERDFITVRG